MSAFKGTPGPWRAEVNDGPIVLTVSGASVLYASVGCGERAAANAVLAAQAPAMLEAMCDLEVMANTLGYCYDKRPENFAVALREFKDAGAKARTILAALREGGAI